MLKMRQFSHLKSILSRNYLFGDVRSCSLFISSNYQRHVSKPPNFIATPIFYVNSVPHIGHLYTTVYADAIFRFSKLINPESEHIFSTGTDEHGLKVQRSAEAQNQDPILYCDHVSSKFYHLFKSNDISFTVFNRTTDKHHEKAVHSLWNLLMKKGYIYKSTYKGYYSVSDESFVPENAIVTNNNGTKISAESGHSVEWHEEENYMFRLSSLQSKLVDWIDNHLIVKPENFHAALKADIRNIKNLKDISISRTKSRLKWGIEVPNDNTQVIYVWFDALVNYLTASGYPDTLKIWPPCHLIGKDILKFHAIYWPAFLIAADLEPPTLIYCHSHWLYDEQKMSKSKGNVVDPNECISKFTSDGIRFFLLKEGAPHSDSNFNMDKVMICLNSELANTFGNLLNRCTSPKLNSRQHFPRYDVEHVKRVVPESIEILEEASNLTSNCYQAYLNGNFYIGITQIMDFLRSVNGLINITQPWSLVDSVDGQERLDSILYVCLEAIRITAVLLQPVIPQTSKSVFDKLNIDHEMRTWKSADNGFGKQYKGVNLAQQKYLLFSKLR